MVHLEGREEREIWLRAAGNCKSQFQGVSRQAPALSVLLARLYRLYKKAWSRLQARAWKRDVACWKRVAEGEGGAGCRLGKEARTNAAQKVKVSAKESALASQVNLVISYTAGEA